MNKPILIISCLFVAACVLYYAYKKIPQVAEDSNELTTSSSNCNFEESEYSPGNYLYVVPPDNKWYKTAHSLRKGIIAKFQLFARYNMTHTNSLIKSVPSTDTTGLLDIEGITSIDWGKISDRPDGMGKQVFIKAKTSRNVQFRYNGKACVAFILTVLPENTQFDIK
jgi:hypothetical protein